MYIGLLKGDTRLIFLVKLSDHTMDIIQEKEGTTRCNDLLTKSMGEDHTEEKHHMVSFLKRFAYATFVFLRMHWGVESIITEIETVKNATRSFI